MPLKSIIPSLAILNILHTDGSCFLKPYSPLYSHSQPHSSRWQPHCVVLPPCSPSFSGSNFHSLADFRFFGFFDCIFPMSCLLQLCLTHESPDAKCNKYEPLAGMGKGVHLWVVGISSLFPQIKSFILKESTNILLNGVSGKKKKPNSYSFCLYTFND